VATAAEDRLNMSALRALCASPFGSLLMWSLLAVFVQSFVNWLFS